MRRFPVMFGRGAWDHRRLSSPPSRGASGCVTEDRIYEELREIFREDVGVTYLVPAFGLRWPTGAFGA